jgi:hypothetical protein
MRPSRLLTLFPCAIRDTTKLTHQLLENGAPVIYESCSLSVAHWLSRVKAGSRGDGMQLAFDVLQRLLLSPPDALVPAIVKDSASMFHLGLTDEANASAELSAHAPDHECLTRAYNFNASPINGSVRSAIMQSAPLPYYYILCSRMQVARAQ